jgi:hypothetical protein
MLPSASVGIGTVSFLSDDMLNRATALEPDPASEYWLTPVERIRRSIECCGVEKYRVLWGREVPSAVGSRSTECCGVEMVSLGGLVYNGTCHRSMAWHHSASIHSCSCQQVVGTWHMSVFACVSW